MRLMESSSASQPQASNQSEVVAGSGSSSPQRGGPPFGWGGVAMWSRLLDFGVIG